MAAAADQRVLNFAAGPAALPEAVLREAQAELLSWHGSGASVMELSHRSAEFESILRTAKDDLRALLGVPDNYRILFMQGGGTHQFSCVPLNLVQDENATVDYIVTGVWSEKAAAEARRYCRHVNIAANGKTSAGFTHIPPTADWKLTPGAKYVYICSNETVNGVQFEDVPDVKGATLVADMSSDILSKRIDVTKFGLIFAGAQKNIGPSGVTIVIVREDLLGKALPITPIMCDYKLTAENDSLYNTPPTFGIYMAGLVFKRLRQPEQGGVEQIEAKNERKARMIYGVIDSSNGFYWCPVALAARSRMNIPFRIRSREGANMEALEDQFVKESEEKGMIQLRGHRSVGGIRASLYNAVTEEATCVLANFMRAFMNTHAQI